MPLTVAFRHIFLAIEIGSLSTFPVAGSGELAQKVLFFSPSKNERNEHNVCVSSNNKKKRFRTQKMECKITKRNIKPTLGGYKE